MTWLPRPPMSTAASPMNNRRFAFFDVDETLISIKSMFSFRCFYFAWLLGNVRGREAVNEADRVMSEMADQGSDRQQLNRQFYRQFKGHRPTDVRTAAQLWYEEVSKVPGFFVRATIGALRKHQADGVEAVFVSGSCTEILAPLARDLSVQHVLANRLATANNFYTGELIPPQTIGEGKRAAISQFIAAAGVCSDQCYGYGDHLSDLPMLELVGLPTVLTGDPRLLAVARERRWPTLPA